MHVSYFEKSNLLQSVFEATCIGISVVNEDGYFVDVNKTFCSLYGYEKEEIIGKYFTIIYDEKNKNAAVLNHKIFFKNKEKYTKTVNIRKKDNTNISIELTAEVIYDDDGNPYKVSTFINNEENKYNELVQSVLLEISQAISISDSIDELYKLLHFYISQIMPTKNFYIALFDDINKTLKLPYFIDDYDLKNNVIIDARKNRGLTIHVLTSGKVSLFRENDILEMISNGEIVLIGSLPKVYLAAPLFFKEKPIGVIALQSYDDENTYTEKDKKSLELLAAQVARVIERKMFEEELIIEREKANESNRIKSEFLAQISHEIRTPINSILSFSSLIREDVKNIVSEELIESFNLIDRGGKRLIRTIDLILNVAQIQTGKYNVELEEVDIAEDIIYPLIAQFEKTAENVGLKLYCKSHVNYSRIVCDYYSMNQLFINLIDNAIKYTNKGEILVQINSNEKCNLIVDVIDTGIGISEEYLDKIFEIFTQEETGYSRKFEGTGLGLSLVKNYAKLNNADVFVKSKKGEGSKFSVIFN